MCVDGVFVKVSHKVYVKLYHKSIAASSVSHFPGPAITKEDFQLSKSGLQSFYFGSLVVNEDDLPLNGDVTKIDDATCAKLVHESFIIPTTSIPELYYNESFKIQLKYHLQHKGYSVSSQQTGILPYNSYYKSVVDLLITKTESSTSPFSSFLVKAHLSAIRFLHIAEGRGDPFLSPLNRFHYTIRGVKCMANYQGLQRTGTL